MNRDASPRRAHPMTRGQKLRWTLVGALSASMLLLVGAIVSDGYTRGLDRLTEPKPRPHVTTYPVSITQKSQLGGGFIFQQTPDLLGSPPSSRFDKDVIEWSASKEKTPAYLSVVVLAITAPHGVVNLMDMRVVEDGRSNSLSGSYVGPIGAGDFYERPWRVDFDSSPVVQGPVSAVNDEWELPISIGQADTVVIEVLAKSENQTVSWHLDLDYVDPASGTTEKLSYFDADGEPFKVSGTKAVDNYWDWYRLEWVKGSAQ